MKVLMVNGSPHGNGNTYIALHEMEEEFKKITLVSHSRAWHG